MTSIHCDAIFPHAAKWAFSTRRVTRSDAVAIDGAVESAKPGDVVLARVELIGSHKRLQLATGRGSELYVGDLVVLACGARYAPDQYEGFAELRRTGADMLASGGIIGQMRCKSVRMSQPTRLAPLGLVCGRKGTPLNTADYAVPMRRDSPGVPVIAAIGTSMNAGKTTAVASLVHGLTRAGFRVAAIKATGTGAFGDYNAYVDAGACHVSDFVDAGMVSTYREPIERIEAAMNTLLCCAADSGCDVAVVELADGLFQTETAALLRAAHIRDRFSGVVFAAPDAASAIGGCATLRSIAIEPTVVTGLISCSPLAMREAEAVTGLEVADRETLCDPAFAGALFARLHTSRSSRQRAADAAAGVAA
jgi:hypothetical protein